MRMTATTTTAMILLVLQAGTWGQTPARADLFDVILRNGTIIDGTGDPPFRADVGIVGDHILRIGDLSRIRATLDLDVEGLYVGPGFINLHSHASPAALPTAENMRTQGVTTEILNPMAEGALISPGS